MRVIALTTLLLILGTAHADSQVVAGNPEALECFRATTLPDSAAASSITSCTTALNARRVTRREKASVLVNRGILYNHVGDYAAAVRDFENALELVPNFAEAFINRGNSLFYMGKIDAAIENYSRAIQYESGKLHTAYFNRGLVNEKRKQHQRAYADFVRANELKPDWVLAAGRVELYRQQGFDRAN